MAGTTARTGQQAEADSVPDERDTSPRAKSDNSGTRLRAIPSVITKNTGHATTIEVRRSDFKTAGIDHPTVQFDFRKDNFTLKVGKNGGISKEAADFLSKEHPHSFEYLDSGDDE